MRIWGVLSNRVPWFVLVLFVFNVSTILGDSSYIFFLLSRLALVTTVMLDAAMAISAMTGWRMPATARGMAMTL